MTIATFLKRLLPDSRWMHAFAPPSVVTKARIRFLRARATAITHPVSVAIAGLCFCALVWYRIETANREASRQISGGVLESKVRTINLTLERLHASLLMATGEWPDNAGHARSAALFESLTEHVRQSGIIAALSISSDQDGVAWITPRTARFAIPSAFPPGARAPHPKVAFDQGEPYLVLSYPFGNADAALLTAWIGLRAITELHFAEFPSIEAFVDGASINLPTADGRALPATPADQFQFSFYGAVFNFSSRQSSIDPSPLDFVSWTVLLLSAIITLLIFLLAHARRLARTRAQQTESALALLDQKARDLTALELETRNLIDLVPAMIWYKDDLNNVIRVNRSAADAVGLPVSQIEGRPLREILPAEADRIWEDDLAILKSGQPRLEHLEPLAAPGQPTRWFRTDKVPLLKSGKRGVISISVDVTKESEHQFTLKAHEEFLADIVNISSNVSGSIDDRITAALEVGCKFVSAQKAAIYYVEEFQETCAFVYDPTQAIAIGTARDFRFDQESADPRQLLLIPFQLSLGTRGWLEFEAAPSTTINQSPLAKSGASVLSIWISSTIRRQNALDEIAENESRLRETLERLPVGILLIDRSGLIEQANQKSYQIFGFKTKPLVGELASAILPDASLYDTSIPLSARSESDICGRRYDGSYVHLEVGRNSIHLGSDRFTIISIVDISESRAAIQALAKSEERFHLAADGASVGIWDWFDLNGDKEWWSPRFFELLGYESGEIAPSVSSFDKLVHPDDCLRRSEAILRCLNTAEPSQVEYRLRTKSGRYRWFQGYATVLRDPEGNPTRMAGSIMDIQLRKDAELQLEEHTKNLVVSNKRLQHFAYIASHDLQEPLRMITSYLDLLNRRMGNKLEGESKEFIDFAVDGAQRMSSLINSLLEFSKLTSQKVTFRPINILDVFNKTRQNLEVLVTERSATIESGPLPDSIVCEEIQLVQLFQNLIGNAIKFCPDIPPIVRLTYRESEDAHEFSVSDNGIGIDSAHQERIFEIFQKLHPLNEYPGNGIGLSLCRAIAESHQGTIAVNSTPGEGSTFTVSLSKTLTPSSAASERQGK